MKLGVVIKAGCIEPLQDGECARLDVGALVLVREVDRGVEFGEVGDGEPIAQSKEK